LQQAVRGTSQLEGAPGLQTLALQPDAGATDFALDQRRPLDETVDALRGFDDVFAAHDGRFS
jgi:hypothetical protein